MISRLKKLNAMAMVILLFFALLCSSVNVQAKEGNTVSDKASHLIVIDPGCQSAETLKKESIGPGDWTRISENITGATGATTGIDECTLNLRVALKVQQLLKDSGYKVELTRCTNDVDMSNVDRAMFANTLEADLYISIHASSQKSEDEGILVLCETEENPYNYKSYRNSRLLADTLLGSMAEKTSNKKYKVKETDELMGINWCTIPNAVVVIGNLNNEADEQLLNDTEYLQKVSDGIVSGSDSYFAQK